MAKKSDAGTGVLLVIGVVFAGLAAAYEWAKNNLLIVALAVVGAIVGITMSQRQASKRREARLRELVERFGSEEIAHDIMSRKIWPGQTEEMLTESRGTPQAVDTQRLKTKHKEVWKYGEGRKNQFSLKITLENGRVVAWDEKSS